MAKGDGFPQFSLFNTRSHLEQVRVSEFGGLAVLMPSAYNSMAWEPVGDGDGDVLVEVEHVLATTEDHYAGRYEISGFAVHRADYWTLTPEAIRSMPIGEICARALLHEAAGDRPHGDLLALAAGRVQRIGGREGELVLALGLDDVQPTDDEQIALRYTLAKLFGQDTNRVIAAHLGITPAAAAQRIRRLRQHGHLPPASGQGARRS